MQDLQESHPTEGAGTESLCHGRDAEAQQRTLRGQSTPGPGRALPLRRIPLVGGRPRQLPVPVIFLVGAIQRQLRRAHGSQAGSGGHGDGHGGVVVVVPDAGGEHGHHAAPAGAGEARRPAHPAGADEPWSVGLDARPVPATQPMAGSALLVSIGSGPSTLLKGQLEEPVALPKIMRFIQLARAICKRGMVA